MCSSTSEMRCTEQRTSKHDAAVTLRKACHSQQVCPCASLTPWTAASAELRTLNSDSVYLTLIVTARVWSSRDYTGTVSLTREKYLQPHTQDARSKRWMGTVLPFVPKHLGHQLPHHSAFFLLIKSSERLGNQCVWGW